MASKLIIHLSLILFGLSLNGNAQITIEMGAELYLLYGETITVEGNVDNAGKISGKGTINIAGDYNNTGELGINIGPDQSTHLTIDVIGIFTPGGNFTVTNDLYNPTNADEATIVTSGNTILMNFLNTENNSWLADYNLPNSGDFKISYSSVLPIKLLNFVCKYKENQVLLNWTSTLELNNKGFEIERSQNVYDWINIGFMEGNANTIEGKNYQYIDKNPTLGVNYYRLKQIDFDGKFKYSKVISCNEYSNKSIIIYPNPTNGIIEVMGMQGKKFKIIDSFGSIIKEGELSIAQIDISYTPQGVYFLQVFSEDIIASKTFFKY